MKCLFLAIVLILISHTSFGSDTSEIAIPDSLEKIVEFERHNISQSKNQDQRSYAYNVGHTDNILFYLMINSELDEVDKEDMERFGAIITFNQWLVGCSNQFVREVLKKDWEVHYVYHDSTREQHFVSKVDTEICEMIDGEEVGELATRYVDFINKRLPLKMDFGILNEASYSENILAFDTTTNIDEYSQLVPQDVSADREAAGESLTKLFLVKEAGNHYCSREIYDRFLKNGIVISVTYRKSDGSEIITFYLTEERCEEYKDNEQI